MLKLIYNRNVLSGCLGFNAAMLVIAPNPVAAFGVAVGLVALACTNGGSGNAKDTACSSGQRKPRLSGETGPR